MKKYTVLALGLAVLAVGTLAVGGPRGGGGARGGAAARGGTVHSYGGSATAHRSSAGVVGPAGGTAQAGRTSGSATTRGGTTVNYAGAGSGRTTPGGAQAGRAVGGVQVTTPGGREATKVGHAGGVSGPGGRAVGGRESTTAASGPGGSAARHSQSGAAIGPQGGVATRSTAGAARTGGGAAVAGSRGAVATGHYGAAAGRTTAVAGRGTAVASRGTYYRSSSTIRTQGVAVRHSAANYTCFRSGWYTQHPGAWVAAGWAASSVWRSASWNSCATYCAISSDPIYYDYGSNVAYQEDGVYVDGEMTATTEQYVTQAITFADTGRAAKARKDQDWLALGVFGLVQGEEETSNYIFQLAVNEDGVIRGNCYDAVADSSSEVFGYVDRKSQRAAWTIGDRKTTVYEVGIANLTREATTMMVHYDKERSVQYSLVRLEDPDIQE